MRDDGLPPHYGNAVSGEHYWPRPDITDPLLRSLDRGQSHSLFGPRRTGKSSILLAIKAELEAAGVLVCEVNVESGNGLEDLFGALLRRLPSDDYRLRLIQKVEAAKGVAAPVLGTLKRWLGAAGVNAQLASERDMLDFWPVLSEILAEAIRSNPKRIVMLIDELPFLIQNTITLGKDGTGLIAARNILATLREWRRIPHVSMVIAGSIGIRGVAMRHGLDPNCFNDMLPVEVSPLAPQAARAMLTALLKGAKPPLVGWTEQTSDALLASVPDLFPGFIQLAFQCVGDREAVTPDAVQHALHNHYEPQLYDQFFVQFDKRLQREEQPLRGHLTAVIDLAVDTAEAGGATMDAVYDLLTERDCERPEDVAAVLREDGFLRYDLHSERLVPTSRMVTAWRKASPRPRRRPPAR